MKCKELIEKLSLLPPDFEVFGMDDFNDIHEYTGVQVRMGAIYLLEDMRSFKAKII